MHKRLGAVLVALLMLTMTVLPAAAESIIITGNRISSFDDFDYEFWRDKGDATMTMYEDGKFDCVWDKNKTNNVLFRAGKKFNKTKTHEELGNISLIYGCDFNPDGTTYLCVYGWSVNPLVEFYIVESWGNWRPPGASSKGTVTIDGGTYDIYETTRTEQPSIEGTATFQQYWSVRTSKKTEGTISISEHIKAWEEKGMSLGKMYEVSLCIEAYQSSGNANVYKNILTVGSTIIGGEAQTANTDNTNNTSGINTAGTNTTGTGNNNAAGGNGNTSGNTNTNSSSKTENSAAADKKEEAVKTSALLPAPKVKGAMTGKNLKLSWNKIEGAYGYRVYLYNTETEKYERIMSVKSAQAVIKDVKKGTYKYKVTAVEKTSTGYRNGKASAAYKIVIK